MMNPEAVARAAEAGPKPPPSPSTGPLPPTSAGGGGLETMVKDLEGVGSFLQGQGPKGQKAMAAFQALLTELAQLSQDEPLTEPEGDSMGSGRIHESMRPGVQVL